MRRSCSTSGSSTACGRRPTSAPPTDRAAAPQPTCASTYRKMTNSDGGPVDAPEPGSPEVAGHVLAIVAGHGDWATGVLSAVAQITGRGDAFVAMSNRDMGADEIESSMRAHADATGA